MTTSGDTSPISPTPLDLAQADLLLARIVDFARLLWELGLDIGPGSVVEVAQSLPLINVGRMDEFYTFLKISLVTKARAGGHLRPGVSLLLAAAWRECQESDTPRAGSEASAPRAGAAVSPEGR